MTEGNADEIQIPREGTVNDEKYNIFNEVLTSPDYGAVIGSDGMLDMCM